MGADAASARFAAQLPGLGRLGMQLAPTFAPVLVINLRAVFGRDHGHVRVSSLLGLRIQSA
jgi:hypothetical protein